MCLKHLSLKCDSLLQLHPFTDQQCMGQWADGGLEVGLSQPPWSSARGELLSILVQLWWALALKCPTKEPAFPSALTGRALGEPACMHETLQALFWKTACKQKDEEMNGHKIMPRHFHQIYREGRTECPKDIWSSKAKESTSKRKDLCNRVCFPSHISRPHIKAMAPLQTSSALGRDKDDKRLVQLKSIIVSSVFQHCSQGMLLSFRKQNKEAKNRER